MNPCILVFLIDGWLICGLLAFIFGISHAKLYWPLVFGKADYVFYGILSVFGPITLFSVFVSRRGNISLWPQGGVWDEVHWKCLAMLVSIILFCCAYVLVAYAFIVSWGSLWPLTFILWIGQAAALGSAILVVVYVNIFHREAVDAHRGSGASNNQGSTTNSSNPYRYIPLYTALSRSIGADNAYAVEGTSASPLTGYKRLSLGTTKDGAYIFRSSANSNYNSEWTNNELTFSCKRVGHKEPPVDCSCGIYSVKDCYNPDLSGYSGLKVAVLLWGTCIDRGEGYRAQHARIVGVFGPRCYDCQRNGVLFQVRNQAHYWCGFHADLSREAVFLKDIIEGMGLSLTWEKIDQVVDEASAKVQPIRCNKCTAELFQGVDKNGVVDWLGNEYSKSWRACRNGHVNSGDDIYRSAKAKGWVA